MRWLISCLMPLVVLSPGPAQGELPATPEGVLPYLEAVYKRGDIEGYADLLAADYTFVLEDMSASWDAATDVKGTRKLFEAASAQITFPKDAAVQPGSQPGTWVIEHVTGMLAVTQKKDGKAWKIENTFSFVIRKEDGGVRIVEWRQHPDE